MRIGYRCSSDPADRDALLRARCSSIFTEQGVAQRARPELAAAMRAARGHVLIVPGLNTLAAKLPDLIERFLEMREFDIGLIALKEGLDTSGPDMAFLAHMATLDGFEREAARMRQLAGVRAARAQGKLGGRPRVLSARDLATIKRRLAETDLSVCQIAAEYGVNPSTLYRHLDGGKQALLEGQG